MTKKLYIIGNGFDMHHGIASSYKQFGEYLEKEDNETYELIDRFIGLDDEFWNELEVRLAGLDSDYLLEDMSGFLPSYGADNWSDSGHHDFQYEVDRVVSALSKTLLSHFSDWIRQLEIPSATNLGASKLPLDVTSKFLSFNYTNTLQKAYGVPDSHILHIHGIAIDPNSILTLGHGYTLPNSDPYRYETNPEDADIRVVEAISIIDDYFENTFKNTAQIISNNLHFFLNLSNVSEVIVCGHSLEDVDAPYFEELIKSFGKNRVNWTISYYGDLESMRRKAIGLNIDPAMTKFIRLKNLV